MNAIPEPALADPNVKGIAGERQMHQSISFVNDVNSSSKVSEPLLLTLL
jgi:hypothetical protein